MRRVNATIRSSPQKKQLKKAKLRENSELTDLSNDIINEASAINLVSETSIPSSNRELELKITYLHPAMTLSDQKTSKVPKVLRRIVYKLLKKIIPTILSYIALSGVDVISLYFVGRLEDSKKYLAVVGFAQVIYIIIGSSIVEGMQGSLATLCGQAYGKEDYKLMGVYLNRARIIYTIILIPSIGFFLFNGQILSVFSMDEELISLVSTYLKCMIPAFLLDNQFGIVMEFLQAQELFLPPMIITWITFLLHIFFCYFFIELLNFGYLGAAYATVVLHFLNFLLLTAATAILKLAEKGSWFCLDKTIFGSEVWTFVKLTLWCAALQCLEWWGFEFLTVYAAHFGQLQLDRYVISISIVNLIYMIPFSVQAVLAYNVAKYVGGLDISKAKRSATITIQLGMMLVGVVCLLLIVFRKQVPRLYTDNEEILADMEILIILVAIYFIPSSLQSILCGVLIGLELQKAGTIGELIMYYPILQPLAYFLAFTCQMEIKGLFITMVLVEGLMVIIFFYLICTRDWGKIAKFLKEKMDRERIEKA